MTTTASIAAFRERFPEKCTDEIEHDDTCTKCGDVCDAEHPCPSCGTSGRSRGEREDEEGWREAYWNGQRDD